MSLIKLISRYPVMSWLIITVYTAYITAVLER